ncbi:MAG: hypothetical protein L0Y56_19585, partial [Nitrospira sp.]|nr:hypothetical protein [Nitrospira sp.]
MMGYVERLQVALGEPYAHRVSSIDRSGLETFFLRDAALPTNLVKFFGSFDLILSYKQDPEGFWTENLRKTGAQHVYTFNPFPPVGTSVHIVIYLLGTLKALGLNVGTEFSPIKAEESLPISEPYHPRVYPPSWARDKTSRF